MKWKVLTIGLLLIALIFPIVVVEPVQGTLAPEPPDPSSKNYDGGIAVDTSSGTTVAATPEPSSKNYGGETAVDSSSGTTVAATPDPASKNYGSDGQASTPLGDIVASLSAGGSLVACGASGNLSWSTTSSGFQVIRQCTLSVPQDGWVFISADGSLARMNGEYEAQFEIGIDTTSGDGNIDRWVNVYNDTGDGTDESVALSVLKPVTVGTHTFYSLGRRYYGTATVLVYDPTLTVVFIPAANTEILPCGASGALGWSTTSSGFQVIRQCTLSVPQDGWVFISADGSLGRLGGEYEAQFEIGIDSTSGDWNIDRWVNVYNDTGDGTDRSVALSVLKPVTAGTHTFYFLGSRYDGTATVLVYDPTLTVVFIPCARLFIPLVVKGW